MKQLVEKNRYSTNIIEQLSSNLNESAQKSELSYKNSLEISNKIEEVSKKISTLAELSQTNKGDISKITQFANELLQSTRELKAMIDHFKV